MAPARASPPRASGRFSAERMHAAAQTPLSRYLDMTSRYLYSAPHGTEREPFRSPAVPLPRPPPAHGERDVDDRAGAARVGRAHAAARLGAAHRGGDRRDRY